MNLFSCTRLILIQLNFYKVNPVNTRMGSEKTSFQEKKGIGFAKKQHKF